MWQTQQGSSDCNLLWPLLLLCVMETIHWRLITFRTCFVDILSNVFKIKNIKPFPRRSRKRIDRGVYSNVKFAVYCSCQQPKDAGKMVECDIYMPRMVS